MAAIATQPENPLTAGLERLPVAPTTLAIFGATGDLARRKLLPALYNLARDGALPERFHLVGVARREKAHEDYREECEQAIRQFSRRPPDEDVLKRLLEHVRYVPGTFDEASVYTKLEEVLDGFEEHAGVKLNRLFYLSTAPAFFPVIVQALGKQRLDRHEGAEVRVVIEKPFGTSLAEARELNRRVLSVFDEHQVFRIDHYLGKETVQNLLVFRFANSIFEPLWNNHYVDHVQITVAEDMGLEGRASYYDESGALRDIVQNHLLQLVSLTAMEPPISFQADAVRDEKVKVLRAIRAVREDEVARYAVRGQYGRGSIGGAAVPSYRKEDTGNPHSNTDTFVAMRLDIQNWRWAGTPFYVRTGKRLPRRVTEIAVQFKQPPHQGFANTADPLEPNLLVIRIQPDEGTTLKFGAKVPAPGMRLRAVNMDFLYGASFVAQSPEAYERLLLDVMRGDQTLFARRDEVETAWSLLSGVLKDWENAPDIPLYPAGSWGPEQADQLMAQDRRRWRHP